MFATEFCLLDAFCILLNPRVSASMQGFGLRCLYILPKAVNKIRAFTCEERLDADACKCVRQLVDTVCMPQDVDAIRQEPLQLSTIVVGDSIFPYEESTPMDLLKPQYQEP